MKQLQYIHILTAKTSVHIQSKRLNGKLRRCYPVIEKKAS